MRKPMPFVRYGWILGELRQDDHDDEWFVHIGDGGIEACDAKALAAWLLKAAAWIREQEGK